MSERPGPDAEVEVALRREFAGVHPPSTITRCVEAAHYSALEVIGCAQRGVVEGIARRHLEVLAFGARDRD